MKPDMTAEDYGKLIWSGGVNEKIITEALTAFGDRRFEEGLEVGNEKLKVDLKHWTDITRRAALEEAAKMVETLMTARSDQSNTTNRNMVAQAIRALIGEGGER